MSADPGPSAFGRLVRGHRERLLLTQEELAARSGLSTRAISYLEAGRVRRPRAASVRILADALNLTEPDRTELRRAASAAGDPANPADRRRFSQYAKPPSATQATRADRVAGAAGAVEDVGWVRPVDLPAVARSFVGRDDELARLDAIVGRGSDADDAGRVALLSGTAGVGKTALSLRWAHRAAADFPDGQIYLDLHGFSPVRPVTATTALGVLIRALDPDPDVPHEIAARIARFRTLASDRRLLIVVDNARSVDQVRPLLPGTASCAVIVTSRYDLSGLVVRDGAVRVEVRPLSASAGLDLLTALVPEQLSAATSAEAIELLDRCARLPLAIRIAAETLAGRTDLSVAGLAGGLADEGRRLDLLGVDDDPETGVRDVLSWSYRLLDPDAARAFEIVGAQPCADIDPAAAAALLKVSADETAELLGRLARAHLIEWTRTTDRIRVHDLLGAYAHQLVGPTDLDAAIERLADHQLAVAGQCVDVLYPHASRHRPGAEQLDVASATAWLDRERENLLTLGLHPVLAGRAVEFSDLLWRYLFTRGFYAEAAQLHEHAMTVATARHDRRGEAVTTRHLAGIRMRTGDYPVALELTDRALALHAETGDDRAVGAAHNLRGVLLERTGRPAESLTSYWRAHTVAERLGDDLAIASTLNNIGCVLEHLGRADEAVEHLEQALRVRRRIGDRPGEGLTLGNLAVAHRRAGRYERAFELYEQAIEVAREVGERNDEAYILDVMAGTLRLVGRLDEARTRHEEALAIATATGNKPVAVSAVAGLAEVEAAAGRLDTALDGYAEALSMARSIGDRHQEARALTGAGRARRILGDIDQARDLLEEAHKLYATLGNPEAADVLAELDTLR